MSSLKRGDRVKVIATLSQLKAIGVFYKLENKEFTISSILSGLTGEMVYLSTEEKIFWVRREHLEKIE